MHTHTTHLRTWAQSQMHVHHLKFIWDRTVQGKESRRGARQLWATLGCDCMEVILLEPWFPHLWNSCKSNLLVSAGIQGNTLGFPGGPGVKNLPANAGDPRDPGSIPGSGRCSGRGNGNSLHYSCLENSMDRGAWRAAVHGVAKSWTRLSMHTENLRRNPQVCALHKT